ncbi:MAG: glycosyltransferase family protein [Planctomycetota bacterium]|jgi:glycosyltransferase involved in cell wall biosynthesis
MKISAFTFVKNGCEFGYPFELSIRSILPICDEFIVNVGASQDETLERIRAIDSPKITITQSAWNEKLHVRGFTYAQQKMIAQYKCTGDWHFYLEADEVVHEDDLPKICEAMERYEGDPRVEALVFDYYHFYGNINTYLWSPAWYRRAPRIIRGSIRSYAPDGLYWLVLDKSNRVSRLPRAALVGAPIYHYGWTRTEQQMQARKAASATYWGKTPRQNVVRYGDIDSRILRRFEGTHPRGIEEFFPKEEGLFETDPDHKLTRRERRHRIQLKFEKWFGLDTSRKNFRLVRS